MLYRKMSFVVKSIIFHHKEAVSYGVFVAPFIMLSAIDSSCDQSPSRVVVRFSHGLNNHSEHLGRLQEVFITEFPEKAE